MTKLATLLSDFLQQHLPNERGCSQHTVQSYTDSFRLLVRFAAKQHRIRPCQLKIEQLSAALVYDWLNSLEHVQNCRRSTCNVRLASVKSFFHYLEYREPTCLEQARQVQAIVQRRTERPLIDWLEAHEVQAILDAPNIKQPGGVRDRAMFHLCYAAGLRVSELTSMTLESLVGPEFRSVRVMGKGRRERELPLWNETIDALGSWLAVRPTLECRWLFVSARGRALSTDGVSYLLGKYVAEASKLVPSLADKHITPHCLRHSSAMAILHATGDIRKVSLWLGHASIKSTEAYLNATPAEKLQIMHTTIPPSIRAGSFKGVKDRLMAVLGG